MNAGSGGSIRDSTGKVWTISGGQIAVNGVLDASTSGIYFIYLLCLFFCCV